MERIAAGDPAAMCVPEASSPMPANPDGHATGATDLRPRHPYYQAGGALLSTRQPMHAGTLSGHGYVILRIEPQLFNGQTITSGHSFGGSRSDGCGHADRRTPSTPAWIRFSGQASLLGGEQRQSPVVEDEHLNARQAREHAGIASVIAREACVR